MAVINFFARVGKYFVDHIEAIASYTVEHFI
jgi:hypothetical protein